MSIDVDPWSGYGSTIKLFTLPEVVLAVAATPAYSVGVAITM